MGEIKRRHALCLMGVFCLPLPAVSAHRTDSIRNLGEVVVKAKTYKEVIPAQTLKGEELRKLNSFSVADAIRYFSGLQIKDYGGVAGLKTVNIRSMGTNHTGVYYNGIQLGNAQNGQVDLGKFSLDNIEEISLYNGQKATSSNRRESSARRVAFISPPAAPVRRGEGCQPGGQSEVRFLRIAQPSFALRAQISDKSARLSVRSGSRHKATTSSVTGAWT